MSAIDVVSFDASVRGELLLFACPLPFEGVKNSLRMVSGGSERGERKGWEGGEEKEARWVFCFRGDDSSNVAGKK